MIKLIHACCDIKNIVIFKTYTEIKIPLIYDFIRFEIHLPAVVAVDGVPVFNVVVTIVLVVGVIPVIAVIKVHIELNYYLRNKFRIITTPLIYDIIQFEIQLPYVVAVDELPVFNVVVTIVLVVGVVAVISVIQLDIELTYYL